MPLITILLIVFGLGPVANTPVTQSCTPNFTFPYPIITETALDVDRDGIADRVIVYEKEKDIWLGIQELSTCTIVTEQQLTNFIEGIDYQNDFEIEEIYPIQLVELTGDDHPELYVGLDLLGPGRMGAGQHFVYRLSNGVWKSLYTRLMCKRSTLEFRQRDDPTRMDIYWDEDLHCDEVADSTRPYAIIRWFGSDFIWVEEGDVKVDVTSENLPIYLLCFVCYCLPALLALFIFLAIARRLPFVRYGETPVPEKPIEKE